MGGLLSEKKCQQIAPVDPKKSYHFSTATDHVAGVNVSGGGTSIGRSWWPVNRRRSAAGSTWNADDLEARCADLLAWQRKQRLQREQQASQRSADIDLENSPTKQSCRPSEGHTEVSRLYVV